MVRVCCQGVEKKEQMHTIEKTDEQLEHTYITRCDT